MVNIYDKHPNARLHQVEVKIDGTGEKNFLEDDSILREKKIVGFYAVPPAELFGIAALADPPLSPDTNRPLALTPAFFNAYFTIQCGSDSIYEAFWLPACIPTIGDAGNATPVAFVKINPSRCFIRIADAINNAVAGSSFLINFYYLD